MNEKIKQLAEQAALNAVTKNFDGTSVEVQVPSENWAKEFAELIVQECIERVRNQYTPIRDHTIEGKLNPFHSEIRLRTERETGIVECGVNSVISLEELIQEQTDKWYKENILE